MNRRSLCAVCVIALLFPAGEITASAWDAIQRAAEYLVANQLPEGHWGEEGFVGECAVGLYRAYGLLGNVQYKQSAEAAGSAMLQAAGYNPDEHRFFETKTLYAAEAYALSRLSEISDSPGDNQWRTALVDFFNEIRLRSYSTENFIDDLVRNYGGNYQGTALYDLSRFAAAAAYVGDADTGVWRNAIVDLLGEIDSDDDMPVTALASAVWALQLTGGLDGTSLDGSSSFLSGKTLGELPDLLAGLQAPDGSFYWSFDGTFPGYTEPTVMGALALKEVGTYEGNVRGAVALLSTGVSSKGACFFKIFDETSPSAFYYTGETLEVLEPVILILFKRGYANPDNRLDLADAIFLLSYLYSGGPAPQCLDAADVNDDGELDIADPVYLLGYIFQDGVPPPPPFENCGIDRTPDTLQCALFTHCPNY